MKDKISYPFRMIIEKDGKSFHGFVPALVGVHTQGKTIEETKKNLKEAVICHLEGLIKDNEPIPREKDFFESIEFFSFPELKSRKYA